MSGMMRSRTFGRGEWCACCTSWRATRLSEDRLWRREWDYERLASKDPERDYQECAEDHDDENRWCLRSFA